MLLRVGQTGWGDVTPEEIQNLLTDVTKQLLKNVQVGHDGIIHIEPGSDDYPEVMYRNSSSDPYIVFLSARDRYYCQYSYQFAHELCHILSNYERLRLPYNQWFHESLCELASIFVLRQMAVTWKVYPPHLHLASYSTHLASYAADILAQPSNALPTGQSFQDWLQLNEPGLRADPYQRTLNRLVAVRLLPLFEKNPNIWRTIPFLPNSEANLKHYLEEWALACSESDRIYVQQINAALFDLRTT